MIRDGYCLTTRQASRFIDAEHTIDQDAARLHQFANRRPRLPGEPRRSAATRVPEWDSSTVKLRSREAFTAKAPDHVAWRPPGSGSASPGASCKPRCSHSNLIDYTTYARGDLEAFTARVLTRGSHRRAARAPPCTRFKSGYQSFIMGSEFHSSHLGEEDGPLLDTCGSSFDDLSGPGRR